MNAAIACRLKKEARALFPFWAVTAAWITLPFLLSVRDPLPFSIMGFLFGCCTIGPVVVGNEFTQGTMAFLLAQPVPRRQLWREKLLVTGAALFGLFFLLFKLIQATNHWEQLVPEAAQNDPWHMALFEGIAVLIPVMGWCTGPAWALIARNALGGGSLTYFCPQMLLILGVIGLKLAGAANPATEGQIMMSYALMAGMIYSVWIYRVGWRLFERLEDAVPIRRDLVLPASWSRSFVGLAVRLLPEKRGVMTSLILKELRLQQPAFAMATLMATIWLAFLVVWFFRPAIGSALMVVPPFVLFFVIPMMLGSTSTAEERSLGIHDWHLTLPVTARRQWLVKLLTVISLDLVLGLLLPWFLTLGSESLSNNREDSLYGNDSMAIAAITNLVILSAALYASTVAMNTLRAFFGTLFLCITVPLMFSLPELLYYRLLSWSHHGVFFYQHMPWEYAPHFGRFYWVFSLTCWIGWLGASGLRNFRYPIDSVRLPILRLFALITVMSCAVFIGCDGQLIRNRIFDYLGW